MICCFGNCWFNVINVSSKDEFAKELKKPLNSSNDGVGTICIVNIQKLMEESALVIIDINDAIANGYVKLSKNIEKIMRETGRYANE